jgi:ribosomal protein S12 methylthiotransferase accessory factor
MPAEHAGLRVLIVGLSPWGAVAAGQLAAAGVSALHLLDDGAVDAADLLFVRGWSGRHVGLARSEAMAAVIAEASPWCRVTAGPIDADGGLDQTVTGDWDLILGAVPGDELRVLHDLARFAHRRGIPTFYGHLDGLSAVIGPAVIPGRTACWNCCRLRQLACSAPDQLEADHALHASLLAERPRSRVRTYLGPMAAVLGQTLALEALKLLSGGVPSGLLERIRVQDLVSLGTTSHSVLQMPWCDVCGGAALRRSSAAVRFTERLDAARDPAQFRELFAWLLDGRTGIIRRLALKAPSALDPDLPVQSAAFLGAYTEGTYRQRLTHFGSGKGLSAVEAMVGAVGEAIEHYAGGRYRKADLRRASLEELDEEHVDPRELCLYSDAQYADPNFPFARFDPAQPIEWTRGQWLDQRGPVLMPALPTYLDYDAPFEEQFCQVTSSGLAAGADFDDAALRATLELIERDALMITWLGRRPGQRLLVDEAIDEGAREVVRQLEERGARIELHHLDAGLGVPVVACLGFGDGERWPGATLSLSAHPIPRVAARKSILEQGQIGPHIRRLMAAGEPPIPHRPEDVRELMDHALYYAPASRAAIFDFLRAGEPISAADLPAPAEATLDACAALLGRAGVRVAIADVTPPDLRGGPLRVVRALATNLQPIHFGFHLRRLGARRLLAVTPATSFNPHPHPLA